MFLGTSWLSNLSLYVSQSLEVSFSILLTSFDVQLLHNSKLPNQ